MHFWSTSTSIRNVLFGVILVLGGWGSFVSLSQAVMSFFHYRESALILHRARTTENLLGSAQHLAFERGRTAVVLRGNEPISEENRGFIDSRRAHGDMALEAAIAGLKEEEELDSARELLKRWDELKKTRRAVENDFPLSRDERDPRLLQQWETVASDLLKEIRMIALRLLENFRPGETSIRLKHLAATILDLRDTTGWKASLISQVLSSGVQPSPAEIAHINSLGGRERKLWEDITRLISYLDSDTIRTQMNEVRNRNEQLIPLQEQVLAELSADGRSAVSIETLFSSAVPVLNGIAAMMTTTAQAATNSTIELKDAYRNRFLVSLMVSLSLVTLLVVSLYYVVKQVISPLETLDRELNKIGALSHDEMIGNEIKRLSASVKKLERAMEARDLAEVEREKTITQLREALEQIKTLKGFIPICAGCKKIRDDQGYWEQLESYLAAHTDATFSHGLCPECFEKAMAELD